VTTKHDLLTPAAVRAELASTPSSVRTARALVTTALRRWPHLRDRGALLVTELATNAVLHARSTFVVEVAVTADAVRIAVSDTSPVVPQRKRHGAEAGTGRGLGLVALLSSASGCDRHDGTYRKTVWCELPLDPAALPEPDEGALLATG
jgi:anti-sigma regulatory factor (Ser/Thr protein kinase)